MATTKSKPTKTTGKAGRLEATFTDAPDPPQAEARARMALRPSVNAAAVAIEYTQPLGPQDIGALVAVLANDIDALRGGDMTRAEAMLFAQAHALQAIFMNLARRATTQEYMKHWEAYLRMAMKAQNQCRMTLETLATIKNPPVVFARQANINNGGQQQVNNGATPQVDQDAKAPAQAGTSQTKQTELLEAGHGQRVDSRTAGTPSGADPQLATVGARHRAAHR